MAEYQDTDIIICLNKKDLAEEKEIEEFSEIYRDIYPLVVTSGHTGHGIKLMSELMRGRKCAFAGPSGTGKSTLLNLLHEDANVTTGSVSGKTERGRHTTRHVELFKLRDGSMIFDTPGFTSFSVLEAEEDELAFLYPEMRPLLGECRYHNCRHVKEPGCQVRKAVEEKKIPPSRYESYLQQIREIQETRKY